MIWLPHGLSGDLLLTGLIVAFMILVIAMSVRAGWISFGEKVEKLEHFYRVVDEAYGDWDPLLDRGPSKLSVWVQLERIESSGSFIRDLTLAVIGRNEPPRIGLTAFMDERQPVSVIVSPADRPSAKPFASLFPEGYPAELTSELTLIEWRHRLQKRWPKADVTMHYLFGAEEPGGWRKQLDHAEKYILEQQGKSPLA